MIKIIKNEDIFKHVKEYDANLIAANLISSMAHGFAYDVMINYRYAYEDNIKTRYGDPEKLGTILESKKDNEPTFCLCYIVKMPNTRPDLRPDTLEYDALERCLKLVNIMYKGKHIALPILGCEKFDGNGDRDKVLEMINTLLTDVDADVYDFEQQLRDKKKLERYHYGKRILKEKGYSAYTQFLREVNKNSKGRKLIKK